MNHEEDFNVEGYDQGFHNEPLFQDLQYEDHGQGSQPSYQDDGYAEESDDAENFPEPAKAKAERKGLPPMARNALYAVAAVVAVVGGSYIYDPDLVENAPHNLMAMVTGGESEPAPEPAVAKPHRPKHQPGAAQTADKPTGDAPAGDPVVAPAPKGHHPRKPVAAPKGDDVAAKPPADPADKPMDKPADNPEFKPAPHHKPGAAAHKPADKPAADPQVAAKPKPAAKPVAKPHADVVAVAPKPAAKPAGKPAKPKLPAVAPAVVAHASGGAAGPSTSISFASGSYWVAAAEIEHLWSYTSHVKANSGEFTVESWTSKAEGADVSRKRANRVAELITKNTPAHAYKVNVLVHNASGAPGHKVNVSFSSKL